MALPLLAPTGRHIGPMQFLHIADATPHTIGSGTTWNNLLYQSAVLTLSPIGYWRLGEASGNIIDSSGNGNVGTANGTLTYGIAGAITGDSNTAVKFDTTNANNFFDMGNVAAFNFGAGSYTISAWLFVDTLSTFQVPVGKADSGNPGWRAFINGSNNPQLFWGTDAQSYTASSKVVSSGVWQHVVWGFLVGTGPFYAVNGAYETFGDANQSVSSTDSLRIGKDGGANSYRFKGAIDEVAIFNTGLTAVQIKTLYTDGTDTSGQPPADDGGVLTAIQIVKPFAAGSFIEATVDGTQFNINASAPGQVLLDIGFSRNATIQASDNTGHAIVSYGTFL